MVNIRPVDCKDDGIKKSKLKINEVVIVEGKYDKIKLSSIVDAEIIETGGFSIFKNNEIISLIKLLAEKKGILIITDSDGAGFKIRNYIKGAVPENRIKNAFIPDIYGKEKRKAKPSKEGKIGLEGISRVAVIEAIIKSGASVKVQDYSRVVTKTDLYLDGLAGSKDSNKKRQQLYKKLSLPERLSVNMFISVINTIMSYEEYKELIRE